MLWIVKDGGSRSGVIDDHDRCEWVNVASVSAHLRCPGQNPERCKMVVCVCVFVFVCNLFMHMQTSNCILDSFTEIGLD